MAGFRRETKKKNRLKVVRDKQTDGWTDAQTDRVNDKQESSAKLTNQRVSYAFTSSPFSFHARHIVILVFTYLLQTSVNSMCENCD